MSDNRGGARPGAGRKPIYEISESELKQLVKAAKKKAKETGKNLADVLIDLAYQIDDKRTALQALRVYFERVIIKSTERDITITPDNQWGNAPLIATSEEMKIISKLSPELRKKHGLDSPISLPPERPDPAKQIIGKKEPKKNNVIKLDEKK
jgi:hypothetical protein